MTSPPAITIRAAAPCDAAALTSLAQLDSARVPPGRLLTAWAGERLLAALSRDTGAVIADPFTNTTHLVAMLREQAASLHPAPRERAPRLRLATFTLR